MVTPQQDQTDDQSQRFLETIFHLDASNNFPELIRLDKKLSTLVERDAQDDKFGLSYFQGLSDATCSISFCLRFEDYTLVAVGRGIDVLLCGALLVQEWTPETHYFLVPGEHYLDFASLAELTSVAQFIEENPEEAEAIRRRGHAFAQAQYSDEKLIGALDQFLYEWGREKKPALQPPFEGIPEASDLLDLVIKHRLSLNDLVGISSNMVQHEKFEIALELHRVWIRYNGANPHLHLAYYNYGVLLVKANDLPAASDAFHEAIRIHPEYIDSYNGLARIFALTGDKDREQSYLTHRNNMRLIVEGRMDVNTLIGTTEKSIANGEAPFASGLYKSWITHNTQSPALHLMYYNYGVLLLKSNDLPEAKEAFRASMRLEPNYIDAHIRLCDVLKITGEKSAERACWQEILHRLDDIRQSKDLDDLHRGYETTAHQKIAELHNSTEEALRQRLQKLSPLLETLRQETWNPSAIRESQDLAATMAERKALFP